MVPACLHAAAPVLDPRHRGITSNRASRNTGGNGVQGVNGDSAPPPSPSCPSPTRAAPPTDTSLDVSVQNRARLYAAYARDKNDDTTDATTFADAVTKHRMSPTSKNASTRLHWCNIGRSARPLFPGTLPVPEATSVSARSHRGDCASVRPRRIVPPARATRSTSSPASEPTPRTSSSGSSRNQDTAGDIGATRRTCPRLTAPGGLLTRRTPGASCRRPGPDRRGQALARRRSG